MTHPVVRRLRDPAPAVRRAACGEAVDDPSAVLLVPALAEALGDRDKSVRRTACDALVRLGDTVPEVHDALREALRSDDPNRRFGAAWAHAKQRPADPGLLPAVVEGLGGPDADVRWAAARILVDIARAHPETRSVATGLALAGESPTIRRMAVFCLRELADDDGTAERALVRASREDECGVRRAALASLAALDRPGPGVVLRLLEAIADDPDAGAKRLAAISLGEIARNSPAEATLEEARRALTSAAATTDDRDLQRAARRALERGWS